MNNKSKLIAIICATFLAGCSLQPKVIYIDRTANSKLIESSQRFYPYHIHNGVLVKSTNVWTMRQGESFADATPQRALEHRSSWNLPDEAINKYKPIAHKKAPKVLTAPEPKHDHNCDHHREVVSKGISKKSNQSISAKHPEKSAHYIYFESSSSKLTDESRERLRFISPTALLYDVVEIIVNLNGENHDIFLERANAIKDELIRAGYRKANIKIKNYSIAAQAILKFSNKLDVFELNSEQISEYDISKTEWVRIIAGRDSESPLSDALKVKRKLIAKGLPQHKATILYRKQDGKETSALFYNKL